MDPTSLARAVELARARGGASQLCVLRDGNVVLDRWFGCEPDALFLVYSVSKPFVALGVHLLAERGALRLDDPIASTARSRATASRSTSSFWFRFRSPRVNPLP